MERNTRADTQVNKKHLLSYGIGFIRETGEGSRLKNAPHTYKRHIDPWDYDKSLAVKTVFLHPQFMTILSEKTRLV